MPLVKQNMQGINGRHIEKRFYDRILVLLKAKGMNIDKLPRLEESKTKLPTLRNEQDVEKHLLEPLLSKLDYSRGDWEQQIKVKVGRREKAIPDYVILPTREGTSNQVRAAWVWEAKLSIASHKQLQQDFEQAVSYARLLDANGVGLISKEGIWVCTKQEGYSLQKARHWSWQALNAIDPKRSPKNSRQEAKVVT